MKPRHFARVVRARRKLAEFGQNDSPVHTTGDTTTMDIPLTNDEITTIARKLNAATVALVKTKIAGHAYSGFLTRAIDLAEAEFNLVLPDAVALVAKDLAGKA